MEKLELLDSSTPFSTPAPATPERDSTCWTTHHLQQLLRSWKGQHLLGNPLPRHLQQFQAPRTAVHVRAAGTKDSQAAWAARFSPSWQQGQKGRRELVQRGETIQKIRGGKREKKGEEFEQHYWAETFGGQQGDGRVFNTKFSKALHA